MPVLVRTFARSLDWLSARLLRGMMRAPVFRRLFLDRAGRLLVLFLVFEALAIAVSTTVPVWQLLLGPLVLGYAHLVSSLRYFHHGVRGDDGPSARHVWPALGGLVPAHSLWRVVRARGLGHGWSRVASEWQGAWLVDALFLVAVAGLGLVLVRRSSRTIVGAVLLVGPIAWGLTWTPRATTAVLAFGHNFVGVVYWATLSPSRRECSTAWAAPGTCVLASAVLATGLVPPRLPGLDLPAGTGGVSLPQLGRLLASDLDDQDWRGITAAFALGQSTHYFVELAGLPLLRTPGMRASRAPSQQAPGM